MDSPTSPRLLVLIMTLSPVRSEAPHSQPGVTDTRPFITLIALGFFVTTLGQPALVGGLPLRLLLKDQLHVTPSELASFFAIAALAWYLKPLAGLLCDSVPLWGSRRKSYLLLSTLLSSALWLVLGQVTHSFRWLLVLVVALNATIVVASTVLGGVMVEIGQHKGITGQLVSWKFVANNLAGLLVGPMAGYLATRPFVATSWAGAAILLPLAAIGYIALRSESTSEQFNHLTDAVSQIKQVLTNRGLVLATIFIFLVGVNPGFDTPLLYHQTDSLHFTPPFLGWLALVRSITGMFGAFLYGLLCPRFTLKKLLVTGLLLDALGSSTFIFYRSEGTALPVEAVYGLTITLVALPVFDLAARSTPKGCEAMGLALIMSLWNIANALSDITGSWLFGERQVEFWNLVWLNAATTLCILPFVRFVPGGLMSLPQTEDTSHTVVS